MSECQKIHHLPGVNEISISMILGTINLDIDGDIILLNIDSFIDF